jgi:hypothetical protein
MNPYLPPWEYVPDGEPHIFGERVYVYGSHDRAHGYVFCMEDYVCWSAPVNNLCDWKYEGVIYKKTNDPLNADGKMVLYAPDVARGLDGRFYLYYVLDKANVVSVAVCDTPAGEYKFYGYVRYATGELLGEKQGDEPQFDPGVFVDNGKIYLYTGLGIIGDASRKGATATVLAADMLTITEPPVYIVPSGACGGGTSFERHEFFEAPSMRKIGETYYFIYSSVQMSELCYATSAHPTHGFTYGGVIISNGYGNNHGSILQIQNDFYIFYHRLTNDTWFSRQGCIEKIFLNEDGHIPQVEMTSQGARGKPFAARGKFPAYMACNLQNDKTENNATVAIGVSGASVLRAKPAMITQEGFAENDSACFIANICDGTTITFKYFTCENIKKITLTTRAYGKGNFELRTNLNNAPLGIVPITSANIWTTYSADIQIPNGTHALFFTYKGGGTPQMLNFILE